MKSSWFGTRREEVKKRKELRWKGRIGVEQGK